MINSLDKKYFILAVGTSALGKDSDTDLTARCPVCGDSKTKKNSKRLHLYNKGDKTLCNCFNGDCTVQNQTVYRFLKENFPNLLENYKRENFHFTVNKLTDSDSFSEIKVKNKTDLVTVPLEPLFIPLDSFESIEALDYIKKRGIEYNKKFGNWYYCKTDLKIDDTIYKTADSIVIPLYIDGKIYGFYSRKIKEKNFATYMHEGNIGFKIWNWFGINKTLKTYIFEGIFDALSTGKENIIASMGAKIPDSRLSELEQPVFCLDNDKTGLLNSLEYAKRGYSVVIFPDRFKEKDYNDLVLNNPGLDINQFIFDNTFTGIMAEIRIKEKL